jgi:nitrogen fixation protein NifX
MSLRRRLQLVGCTTEEKWMASALKVAFATSDMKHVDQHFGAAQAFAVYALDQEKACFVEAVEFGKLSKDGRPEGHGRGAAEAGDAGPLLNASGHYEDKLADKIDALEGCIAVYSQAVGASAINQLKAKGIQPVKISPGAAISALLASLQEELRQGPGSWLARAIQQATPADPSRFDQMEAEGWDE